MMRKRQLFYGWHDERMEVFRLSREPPDAPVRPSIAFDTKSEVDQFAERKRADVMWFPPLHSHHLQERKR